MAIKNGNTAGLNFTTGARILRHEIETESYLAWRVSIYSRRFLIRIMVIPSSVAEESRERKRLYHTGIWALP